jgi:hypothetical protein
MRAQFLDLALPLFNGTTSGKTPGLPQCFIETAAFDASLFVSLSSRTGIKRTSATLARWQSGKNKIRE